jgi:hypothetical protein
MSGGSHFSNSSASNNNILNLQMQQQLNLQNASNNSLIGNLSPSSNQRINANLNNSKNGGQSLKDSSTYSLGGS